jgi:hypothetical protein
MGYKDDLFEISKEEYQKKVGTKWLFQLKLKTLRK